MRKFFPGRNNYQAIPAMMMKTARLELDTLRGPLPEGIYLWYNISKDVLIVHMLIQEY
jgi:hypothetical protein